MYLIRERRRDFSNRQFLSLTAAGWPGLVVTRRHPGRVRKERGFADSRIIWLTRTRGRNHHDPTELDSLVKVISNFMDKHQRAAVILLDTFEYISVNNGYYQTLLFVERMKEAVLQRKAVMLVPISPDALDEKELALLLRLFPIPFDTVVQTPPRKIRKEFARTAALGVLLVPMKRELEGECERLRELLPMPVDIDRGPTSVEQKIREARRSRLPFIVLVAGGEVRSKIVHVILWTGKENWMSVEALVHAFKEW